MFVKPKKTETGIVDSRILVRSKCPIISKDRLKTEVEISPVIAGVLVNLAESLGKAVIGGLGKAARMASGDGDNTIMKSAEVGFDFYDVGSDTLVSNSNEKCFVFITGRFGKSSGNKWEPTITGTLSDPGFFDTEYPLIGKSQFYLEMYLSRPGYSSGMTIMPSYLFYGDRFKNSGSNNPRDLGIVLSFNSIYGDADKPFSEALLSFNDVSPGTSLGPEDLAHKVSVRMSYPTPDNKTTEKLSQLALIKSEKLRLKEEINRITNPDLALMKLEKQLRELKCSAKPDSNKNCLLEEKIYQKQRLINDNAVSDRNDALKTIDQKISSMRQSLSENTGVNFKVEITETADIIGWLKAVADFLDSEKAVLAKTLASQIDPNARAAATLAKKTSDLTIQTSYNVALIDVQIKEQSLKDARTNKGELSQDALLAEQALIKSKNSANIAALNAGLPIPFPTP